VNGTTLELARSLQRSEGLAALEKVLVLKEIGYAGFVIGSLLETIGLRSYRNLSTLQRICVCHFHGVPKSGFGCVSPISGLQLRRVCRCNGIYPWYLGVAPVTYTRMSGDTDKPCTVPGIM
jgi:hypothetical protein